MHVDMDAFYASVEILDQPELKGKPVIVGGRSARGVVSTCSYEARAFGVHSAMPLFEARRLCPHGIFIPCHPHRYAEMSHKIMTIFRETSPLVEPLSIDEAFVDLTGMEKLGGADKIAHAVQGRIEKELNLSASIGLAPNKFLAKLASDMQKPHGFVKILPEEAAAFVGATAGDPDFWYRAQCREKVASTGHRYHRTRLAMTETGSLEKILGSNAQRFRRLAVRLG